ncbi:MAG: bifunctional diaminohydroxyphosphoribosylaminopyrimidine deaminase/5-amino-6-(5-phosphoribosylamino)uracil reductase RibD [Flavobacteriaceae bacterium]|nr:bifunctional diaminohydroxyphosphoribosylaminopyrimidine deaminase/5-amino-6-(5-phosphoribosylamino)uracil reductase RibD [Flavobacteriaceae bacterium]
MGLDEIYMLRCLQLARRGMSRVSPNPWVGAVLAKDSELGAKAYPKLEKILAEGWHARFGEAHAEQALLNSLPVDFDYSGTTLYVNLEPCAHVGKTPPCANLLIEKGIRRVVVGMLDPNPQVAGKGISLLKSAGIAVELGVLEKECMFFNRRFVVNQLFERAHTMLKWAESSDGLMDGIDPNRSIISGSDAHHWVHEQRAMVDAILVGIDTWQKDKPRLNIRHGLPGAMEANIDSTHPQKNPVRVVLDRHLRGQYDKESLARSDGNLLIVYEEGAAIKAYGATASKGTTIDFNGALPDGVTTITKTGKDIKSAESQAYLLEMPKQYSMPMLMKVLLELGIGSVMVEGGAKVLAMFINDGCVDEVHILRSQTVLLEKGLKAPEWTGPALTQESIMGNDAHWSWYSKASVS